METFLWRKLLSCSDKKKALVGRGVFRNYYKGHMDKTKGEGGGGGGEKIQTTVIEQQ